MGRMDPLRAQRALMLEKCWDRFWKKILSPQLQDLNNVRTERTGSRGGWWALQAVAAASAYLLR